MLDRAISRCIIRASGANSMSSSGSNACLPCHVPRSTHGRLSSTHDSGRRTVHMRIDCRSMKVSTRPVVICLVYMLYSSSEYGGKQAPPPCASTNDNAVAVVLQIGLRTFQITRLHAHRLVDSSGPPGSRRQTCASCVECGASQ